MFELTAIPGGFALRLDGKTILEHSAARPAVFLGKGKENIRMYRGNFDIRDRVDERVALHTAEVGLTGLRLRCDGGELFLTLEEYDDGMMRLCAQVTRGDYNRIWLRFCAEEGEHVLGGGEQFSYLDLRGRLYPIWTREQGVGRNPLTEITRLANAADGGGGDYHTTFFPQPTFISSRLYFAHLEDYEYAELDFREKDFHELGLWKNSFSLVLASGASYRELSGKLTALLGRQKALPAWAVRGIWLGVQGGTERTLQLLEKCREGGMDVSAVWIQDWEGKRVTSFGKRLQWDWRWDREMYPGLDKAIAADPTLRWMGYINPYLVEGGMLFQEAKGKGYFVRRADGSEYLFDFGEYDCGVVDLTMPEAFTWYKNVIKQNLIGLGFRGWMADFGEYLPADAVCYGGTGLQTHNIWPVLWAKCNREAVEECDLLGDCVFFMRAGGSGSQRYATLLWAGDQNVDYSVDDGLPSVVTAALSAGMSGYGLHTCDAGGYTTLFYMKRDEELLLRSLEFTCFTPVMRTHEGNRPDSNVQLYSTPEIIAKAARLSHIHTELAPYIEQCMAVCEREGIPVMRPLFYDEPQCDAFYERELFSYFLGEDVVVAPVVEPRAAERELLLPAGEWIHLWSGKAYGEGRCTVEAPLGFPPVFYRKGSAYGVLFASLREINS